MVLNLVLLYLLVCCGCYIASSVALQNDTDVKEVIYLLTLLPYYSPVPNLNPSWNHGDNIQPALDLAQDQINNSSSLLENYTLKLIHAEAGCNQVARTGVSFVMKHFSNLTGEQECGGGNLPGISMEHLRPKHGGNLAGIVGPGCSASSIGLAPLTSRSDIGLVMVHGSGSPTLTNRTKYQYSIGTLGSTESFVNGFLYLLEKASWNRIAILYDDSRLYYLDTKKELFKRLANEASDVSIEFFSAVSFTHLPLDVIRQSLIRIIYVLCPIELSKRIICLSHSKNMVYSNYQWVFMSQILEQLREPIGPFSYDGMKYNCSGEIMTDALNSTLLMMYRLVPSPGKMPVSNTTYQEYLDLYEAYTDKYNERTGLDRNATYTFWASYLYDAVWAWGIVLDNLTKSGHLGYDRETGFISPDIISEQFYRTAFQGMSGEIHFDNETGYVQRVINISQVIKGTETCVNHNQLHHINCSNNINTILDSFSERVVKVDASIGIVSILVSAIQLVIILTLHVITIVNLKRPSVKASSPTLLHISYIGAYVLVAGVCLSALTSVLSHNGAICWLHQLSWAWFLPVGFTLAFGPVAMRSWRIYRIFEHYLNPGPLISNHILLGGIVLLLCIDGILGVTWTYLDSFVPENETEFNYAIGASVKVKTVCNCAHYKVWFGLMGAYKLGLLKIVSVFGLLTRNISNRSFTTDALRIFAYIITIIFLLGFSLYYILFFSSFDPNGSFVILMVVFNSVTTVFIICIFVPPVAPLLKTYYQKLGFKQISRNETELCCNNCL